MISRALRTIEADLLAMTKDTDLMTVEAVKTAARQIGAQAEMVELGLLGEVA